MKEPKPGPRDLIFPIGELVSGVYEIRELLGQGGMGQVLEALDHQLNRRVAIKVAWPQGHVPPLRNEARALAAFRHPSLVTVHTLGEHRGLDYLVMERIYGVSLEGHMAIRHEVLQPFTVAETLETVGAIAEGLAVVHRAGIAHRDIKPGNIMLTPDHRIVLMDFGLVLPELEMGSQSTVAGSPPYMAPESLVNEIERGQGHLADVYALGVIAFEMLAGRRPIVGKSLAELWTAHEEGRVPSLGAVRAGLPAALVALVDDTLSFDPAQRPQSAEALAWQLRGVHQEAPVFEAETMPQPTGVRVLIVEGDDDLAEILAFYARQAFGDIEVRRADDGVRALEMVRDYAPDVMLIDLHMPRMGGIEVCMHLRGERLAEDCAIIAVSAGAPDYDMELLHQLGIHHFVLKGSGLEERLAEELEAARKLMVVTHRPPGPASES